MAQTETQIDDLAYLKRIVHKPATDEEIEDYARGLITGVIDSASPNVVASLLSRIRANNTTVREAVAETWKAAIGIAKERAEEYAVRADTEAAAGNQSNSDAWANWMKGAERTRQAIHAASIRSLESAAAKGESKQ